MRAMHVDANGDIPIIRVKGVANLLSIRGISVILRCQQETYTSISIFCIKQIMDDFFYNMGEQEPKRLSSFSCVFHPNAE